MISQYRNHTKDLQWISANQPSPWISATHSRSIGPPPPQKTSRQHNSRPGTISNCWQERIDPTQKSHSHRMDSPPQTRDKPQRPNHRHLGWDHHITSHHYPQPYKRQIPTAIKYLGVYLEYEPFFHYSTFYEWFFLLLITHDQSKELKLHECAITRVQDYTNNILPMKTNMNIL